MKKLSLIIVVALSSCGIMEPHQYNCDAEMSAFVKLHGEPQDKVYYENEHGNYNYYSDLNGNSSVFIVSTEDDHCVVTALKD